MSIKSLIQKAVLTSAMAVAATGAASSAGAAEMGGKVEGKEKCFGVVKAGKNDCASVKGTHACAGMSKQDSDAGDWIYTPAGLCEKLAGGSITPPAE